MQRIKGAFRGALRRHPLLYAFVGGVGVVLFWRGVWHTVDFLAMTFISSNDVMTSIDWAQGVDSLISLVLGTALLLSTGLFISELLSGEVLLGKIKEEEAVTQEAERGIEEESAELPRIEREIHHIADEIKTLERDIHEKN